MKINSVSIRNFRTLCEIDLNFPYLYAAICGKNDAGKSNIFRAIRSVLSENDYYRYNRNGRRVVLSNDYPKWKEKDEDKETCISIEIQVESCNDAGLYEFVSSYLNLEDQPETITIVVHSNTKEGGSSLRIEIADQAFDGIKAEQIISKIRSSNTVIFHNSTENEEPYYLGGGVGRFLRDISPEYEAFAKDISKSIQRGFDKLMKTHKKEFSDLLGRLDTKYNVGMSLPNLNFSHLPFEITLGDKDVDVSLDEFGNGTRNRTLILLALLRARQISNSGISASKITPIIIIEEPESFLHPGAQAEFSRILHDLSEEFGIQVIVTTHSPFMLRTGEKDANILLERKIESKTKLRETEVSQTEGDRWMEPFAHVLGLNRDDFTPWAKVFSDNSEAIILVEGQSDIEYLDMLRDPKHSDFRLCYEGEIYSCDGVSNMCQSAILKFIRDKYKRVVLLYDLDVEKEVSKSLKSAGFTKNKDCFAVGENKAGKKSIEGLLPDDIYQRVFQENVELAQKATFGDKDERESGKRELKKLFLNEFKRCDHTNGSFDKFYPLIDQINKALARR